MKININNVEKINETIKTIEGKSTARLLSISDINYCVKEAENKLNIMNIPKKYWFDCIIKINPKNIPNSYTKKYSVKGTHCVIKRFSSDWFIVSIDRKYVNTEKNDKLILSEIAKKNIPDSLDI